MLLVLSSLLGAPGGIPAFNRLLVRAAAEFAVARGLALKVIALTDAPNEPVPPMWLAELPPLSAGFYLGCGGARWRCVGAVLRELPWHREVVFGHVNLAPLGLFLPRYGVIAHGTEVWTPLPGLRRLALRRATAVGCVSEHTAQSVQRVQGVAPARCAWLINALPERARGPDAVAGEKPTAGLAASTPAVSSSRQSEVAGENPAAGPEHRVRVLSVTRLAPAEPKGIDLMLRAIAELPRVEYTVVGTGAALPELQRLAAELGVAARVRFTGALSDAERDAELQRCEIFALPSRGEGFGIVYLEAMAQGKPCLAARAGGAPEVVVDGETGLVGEPTVESVRAALQQLVASPELRQRLGHAGRERVARCFSYAQFRQQAEAFFLRVQGPS